MMFLWKMNVIFCPSKTCFDASRAHSFKYLNTSVSVHAKERKFMIKKKKKVAEINCPAILLSRPTTYLELTR